MSDEHDEDRARALRLAREANAYRIESLARIRFLEQELASERQLREEAEAKIAEWKEHYHVAVTSADRLSNLLYCEKQSLARLEKESSHEQANSTAEILILIDALHAIAHDDNCAGHHNGMAQEALGLSYAASGDADKP